VRRPSRCEESRETERANEPVLEIALRRWDIGSGEWLRPDGHRDPVDEDKPRGIGGVLALLGIESPFFPLGP
jgi:hypothetical protein